MFTPADKVTYQQHATTNKGCRVCQCHGMTGGYFTSCTEHCCNPFVSNPSTTVCGGRGVPNLVSWPTVRLLGLFNVYRCDRQNVYVNRMGWKSSPSALTRPNERVRCIRHYTGKYSTFCAKLIVYGGVQCGAKVTWYLMFNTLPLGSGDYGITMYL